MSEMSTVVMEPPYKVQTSNTFVAVSCSSGQADQGQKAGTECRLLIADACDQVTGINPRNSRFVGDLRRMSRSWTGGEAKEILEF